MVDRAPPPPPVDTPDAGMLFLADCWLVAQVVNGGGITHHDKPPNQEEIQTQE